MLYVVSVPLFKLQMIFVSKRDLAEYDSRVAEHIAIYMLVKHCILQSECVVLLRVVSQS
jgi:hypothetical protein